MDVDLDVEMQIDIQINIQNLALKLRSDLNFGP